jgi:predicted anti-sigma-YlaC factor YlaD
MTCQEAIELLGEYLDGTLTPAALERLEGHLRHCEPCRAYLATYKRAVELAAKVNRVEMPPAVKQRLRVLLSSALDTPS